MRKLYFAFAALLIATAPASAQRILNGGFEANATATPNSLILPADYAGYMDNTGCQFSDTIVSTGVPSVWYLDKNGPEGDPHGGITFLGLQAGNSKTSKISMELDTVTIDWWSRKYTLTYYTKKPKAAAGIKVIIGVSSDCMDFGTVIDSIAAPTDTLWEMHTVTFLPPAGSKYITVRGFESANVQLPNSYPKWSFIDDFSLTPDIVGVNQVKSNTVDMSIYPNPVGASATISLGQNVVLPCNITVYDLTGRLVYQQNNIDSRRFTFNKGELNAGVYILRLKDSESNTGSSRIIIE